MSAIKRLQEELLEHENEILALIKLAKQRRPQLYKTAIKNDNLIICNLLFSGLTENDKLSTLAVYYIKMNFSQMPKERL